MEVKVQMDRETIERELIQAIKECMEVGGKECPELTSETIPLKDVGGFDSLCGIEVLVDLESKLGKELGDNLFVSGSGNTAKLKSIREAAEDIMKREESTKKGTREKHA